MSRLLSILVLTAALAPTSAGANGGAVLRSVALPGWGQHYLGHGARGNVFLGVEAATWVGLGVSLLEGAAATDDYEALALREAGIDASGLDDSMLDDVADFGSTTEYDDYVRRLARYYYPDDPEAQQRYFDANSWHGWDTWSWSSDDERERFEDSLRESREWYRVALYAGAFAVVNRAVSAIDAALIGEEEPVLYSSLATPDPSDFSSVRLTVGARF